MSAAVSPFLLHASHYFRLLSAGHTDRQTRDQQRSEKATGQTHFRFILLSLYVSGQRPSQINVIRQQRPFHPFLSDSGNCCQSFSAASPDDVKIFS